MPQTKVGDIEIYYEIHGDGAPLMLVAGLGGVGSYWQAQIEQFSRHFQVIIHDHRGTGKSTHSRVQYTVDMLARDAIGLMNALGVDRAHFVGHSTGGAIAQILAIEHPERLLSMVQYASWTTADAYLRLCFYARRELLLRSGPLAYARTTPLFLMPNWWIRDNAEKLRQDEVIFNENIPAVEITNSRIDAVLAFDRSDCLAEIAAPTLVVCARDDILTPPYFSEELARRIPGAALILLEKGGHACSKTMPQTFNPAVLEFLLKQQERVNTA
jgi:aminoacrylate hydrolase